MESVKEIKKFPTLYGKTKGGKIKVWDIRVIEDGEDTIIEVTHGQEGGKLQVSPKRIKEGKNVGRSNETTPAEQAISEAESQWKKQLDKNYREDVDALDDGDQLNLLPMLAHPFDKRGKDIVWPAFVQPKLDGIRCFARKVDDETIEYTSRKAKVFTTLDHLTPHLLTIMEVGDVLDGELFTTQLTFQQITSAVKKKGPLTEQIEYWVYDKAEAGVTFRVRLQALADMIKKVYPDNPVKSVATRIVCNEDQMKELHGEFMADGFEGTMIRNSEGEYAFEHRSVDLQKYKDFIDEEFEIIGGEQGVGKAEGQCVFHCMTNIGKVFKARCKGTDAVRREQWENLEDYVGKQLTVRFQGLSDDGVPRFPVGIAVRDYE